VLADRDIVAALRDERLQVEPFSPQQLRPAGLTLHLGSEILRPRAQPLIDFEETDPEIEYERTSLEDDGCFVLGPGAFVLGHTHERISVGAGLGLLVEGRSTLARVGVSVVQAAMVIDTGHRDRPITLELFNAGPSPVALRNCMPVARAILFELSSEPTRLYDDYARYSAQRTGVGMPLAQR
jgi:dCTP deaminase